MSLPEHLPALAEPPRNITAALLPAFRGYVLEQHWRFLLAINLIAMLAYDAYVIADFLLIPDMAMTSLVTRGLLSVIGLINIFLVFRCSRNVLLLDMLMPIHDIISTIAWFELLKLSSSPEVPTFLYASVIFVVLGNLGVRYSFRGVLACSLVISAIILGNVWVLHQGESKPVLVFTLVFIPVLVFSLFISWTTINGVRKAFLADLENRQQRNELANLNLRLHEQASTDALTGISNRRAFDLTLDAYWQQMIQQGRPFALLLVDIDYFKPYNDRYGHQAGDRCLCAVAERMTATLRAGQGSVFRYGGEEFTILLQVSEATELEQIAERLRQQIVALGAEHAHRPDSLSLLTISLGGILSNAQPLSSTEEMLAHCDTRLYQAKQRGRNQACTA